MKRLYAVVGNRDTEIVEASDEKEAKEIFTRFAKTFPYIDYFTGKKVNILPIKSVRETTNKYGNPVLK